ncbi:hypothetical protein F0919_18050 [Taibaiella lutea]|uniref:Uncharacterized protein n=1 Tax=Taibaiella lutea TaxID=2608001 RepID=A0A5M6CC06_9BACT|nr:hypothetical protein [Taibaiella lutea]KAA5532684.1 hypothetical protein F0919_18050 [Taibaiella lutea]
MTPAQFILLVFEVRQLQKKYELTRDGNVRKRMKKYEAILDNVIKQEMKPRNPQQELFEAS